jgi:hypothetical protein
MGAEVCPIGARMNINWLPPDGGATRGLSLLSSYVGGRAAGRGAEGIILVLGGLPKFGLSMFLIISMRYNRNIFILLFMLGSSLKAFYTNVV